MALLSLYVLKDYLPLACLPIGFIRCPRNVYPFASFTAYAAFIRKVYAIISVQLLITFGTVALFIYHAGLNHFVRTHSWYVSGAGSVCVFLLGFHAGHACMPIQLNWVPNASA